ncbi:hypothetical protein DPMN_066502 [Dreissena polymorpha]|uniref:Uncharacterized protein n=1 Tax=Dreissena polymorpha TaxID=45954 RepID=A0A9D3YXY4_DREPO|nr:hypothetical protein DPMN_066502 [Dreissena polymorpha]
MDYVWVAIYNVVRKYYNTTMDYVGVGYGAKGYYNLTMDYVGVGMIPGNTTISP